MDDNDRDLFLDTIIHRLGQTARQLAQEEAVAILPPNTEREWTEYVDQRLRTLIQPRATSIVVETTLGKVLDKRTIISLNTPYKIECSSFEGASIIFGAGENATTVPVFGMMAFDTHDQEPIECFDRGRKRLRDCNTSRWPTSALGQKPTFPDAKSMSALHPEADIDEQSMMSAKCQSATLVRAEGLA